ncbi:MAG: DNA topoisomerase I [Nitrososphaeraceae archaeon]|nr:DNA topoisomerase I [Nitrososphaeraceae archaeon]
MSTIISKEGHFKLSGIIELPYDLVICEKPDAALRIAQALGSLSFKKMSRLEKAKRERLPPVFSVTDRNNQRFVVCSALGHLYGLVDIRGNRTIYPVFDVTWRPLKKKGTHGFKTSAKTEQIIRSISALSHKATRIVHACDYDQEGEVIGYNILQYACDNKYESSLRAKFSTLTDEEIRNSFDNLLRPSKGLAEAGRSRHMIDFIYGVNLSRALTQSYKVSNEGKAFCNLSIGRVQGPTLAFVVEQDIEIRNHISDPYWTISGEFEKNGHRIKAHYHKQKITTQSQATFIVNECTDQYGKITTIKDEKVGSKAPNPFSLGDLQSEAYRVFKFSPSHTLAIAEKLYLDALISYPRSSSQKLPASINYKKIILHLSSFVDSTTGGAVYSILASKLLAKDHLSPNEGRKTDPAHPAIYPTGEKPKRRPQSAEIKLLDLIIKRFFATFGDPAISQHTTITILVKDEHIFIADAKKMIYEGWMYFYKPYSNGSPLGDQTNLPLLRNDDILKSVAITMSEKFTQPPVRFNEASLLQKMEKEKIGTKATRSEIISTLFKRNYITSTNTYSRESIVVGGVGGRTRSGIEATDIGFELVQSMHKYIPNIVSTNLTRSMEEQLDNIEVGKAKSAAVIEAAMDRLKEAIVSFKEKEIDIGRQITEAIAITRNEQRQRQQITLGTCPICKNGELRIIKSNTTQKRFVGCSNYSTGTCKAAAPLPQKGLITKMEKICNVCKWPMVKSTYGGQSKNPWVFCVNMQCPSKKQQQNENI